MKRVVSLVIGMILLLSTMTFLGCKNKVSFNEYTEYEQFRFYCYYTPPQANVGTGDYANNPTYHTEEQYKYIAECGFNYAKPVLENSFEAQVEVLAGLQKYGIKVNITDASLIHMMDLYLNGYDDDSEAIKANKELFKRNYEVYKQYDNFSGVDVADEPHYSRFEALGKVHDFYRTIDTTHDYRVNLLCYSPTTLLGTINYATYLNDAVDITKMSRLCFDSYPLNSDGTVKESHIANNAEVAEKAKEKGIDWDCFILTYQHMFYTNPKNYDDIAWQVYVPMAFGCRGILPFVYMTPLNTTDKYYAMISRDGKPTQIYYSMQEVIKEVRAFEHMYMNSEWMGTMLYVADEDYPNKSFEMVANPLQSHPRIKKLKATADLMIGTYKDKDNRDGFLLVNASAPSKDIENEVVITFDDATHVMLYKKGRKLIVELDKGTLKTDMGSGEGYYVIPFNA